MNKDKHEQVWKAVAKTLVENPKAFTKEEIKDAERFAELDINDRYRDFNLVRRNPIQQAISYSELSDEDRYLNKRGWIPSPNDLTKQLYNHIDENS